jgi:hypothetical protein
LDQDNTIVVVLLHEADSKRGVTIDVLAFKACTSLYQIHGANRGSSLGSIVEGCLVPLICHINLETLAATERADCFNGIDLGGVLPVLNLYESIVQRCTILLIF